MSTLSFTLQLVRSRLWLLVLGLVLVLIRARAGLTIPLISRTLIDTVLDARVFHRAQLVRLVLVAGAATIVQAFASYGITHLFAIEGQKLVTELRVRLQYHVSVLPIRFHDSTSTGVTVARVMNDVEGVRNVLGSGLADCAGSLITAILVFSYLFNRSAELTVLVLILVLGFGISVKRFYATLHPILADGGKAYAQLTGRLTEAISGVRVVKAYRAEEREASKFARDAVHLLTLNTRSTVAMSTMGLISSTLTGGLAMIVMFMGSRFVISHRWSVGEYVQYNALVSLLIAPVFQIVSLGTQLTNAWVGLERTRELLSQAGEDHVVKRDIMAPARIEGKIAFDDVFFSYETGRPVLSGIRFEAAQASVTALVGPSGSGKSTIASLLCAFHTPESGRVLIDGLDLSQMELGGYRKQLGIVSQETFLFDGTIQENVMFSKPEATREQFISACRAACVDEFAESFPQSYSTIVGEKGTRLSGGQRQRISIARALLADPRILILDEATSSLDSRSEELIQRALRRLMEGRTTIVIAHRLSTVHQADQILVLDAGRVVERGNHMELFTRKGLYHQFYTRQHAMNSNLL